MGGNGQSRSDCAPPQKLDFEAVVWGRGRGDLVRLRPLPLGHGAHAVLWDRDGTPLDLGTLDGTVNPAHEFGAIALGINNREQVVGGSVLADKINSQAFLWTKATGMRPLANLPGDVSSGRYGLTIKEMQSANRSMSTERQSRSFGGMAEI